MESSWDKIVRWVATDYIPGLRRVVICFIITFVGVFTLTATFMVIRGLYVPSTPQDIFVQCSLVSALASALISQGSNQKVIE